MIMGIHVAPVLLAIQCSEAVLIACCCQLDTYGQAEVQCPLTWLTCLLRSIGSALVQTNPAQDEFKKALAPQNGPGPKYLFPLAATHLNMRKITASGSN